ncbi:class II fructose-bisphosphate aldolase [Hominifimenecus sp. rT4P-3]|uniref:class II fructose-bisphosphate aldolase n=1 Tax=Hominifimenecus sp. rT4P-3 TaxID=3242979 RepID=UPI003DA3A9C6
MIIPMHELLQDAKLHHYGVAAPNVFNRETIEAAYQVATELHAPVILDVHPVHGIYECACIAKFFEKKYPKAVVALNLDHGSTFEQGIQAIHAGFSSVMVDRSTLPFEENVAQVKEIVKIAHAVGVSVESELGHVGQGDEYAETRDSGLTHLDEAAAFVEQTGTDCLAVSVGTSHGTYKGTPKLEFELLRTLSGQLPLPLVLHGGSNTGDENLVKTIACGISKINLNTDLNEGGLASLKNICEQDFCRQVQGPKGEMNTKRMNLQMAMEGAANGWKDTLIHYVKLFGGENRA